MTKEETEEKPQEEKKSRRPKDGEFRQQRLPAWQPVLTPRTVLPTLFIVGIIFCPAGGLLWWNSNKVDQIMINYSYCQQYTSPVYLAPSLYDYQVSDKNFNASDMQAPVYSYRNESSFLDPSWGNPNNLNIPRCTIDFTIPTTMKGPVFLYYRLTEFYQNHRQYIKNFDDAQLLGNVVSPGTLRTNCDPLAFNDAGKAIFPCGLIANSMFNDTASDLTSVDSQTPQTYVLSPHNIAWPSDQQKYGPTKYQTSEIAPPPNWALRYPNGQYTDEYPPPDLSTQERFMVWMHVAALPDFRKIWARNDTQDLQAGRWRISIDSNFDTLQYGGQKWLVLSTTTAMGGRNPYLGIAYMAIGALCILLGLLFTIRHLIRPRKLGDESSFNLALMLFSGAALAIQPYCQPGFKPIADKDLQLDLSKLNNVFTISHEEKTPPTVTTTEVQVNLCDSLPVPNENAQDFCGKDTLICRRIIHTKGETKSVDYIQPIAENKDNTDFKPIKPEDDATKSGYQYILSLNGGNWADKAQSAQVFLECDESGSKDKPSDPTVVSYNHDVLTLQWKTVFACATKGSEKKPDDDKKTTPPPSNPNDSEKKGMSGIGIFFTIVFVLAAVYFVGGAFYNFKMYNARGLDLIPHREFWFDLPYLIRDLFAHVVDSVMSHRRGTGGYVAV
ncbi:LEM3/CDC50 family protein [Mucor lusitanicus]